MQSSETEYLQDLVKFYEGKTNKAPAVPNYLTSYAVENIKRKARICAGVEKNKK